MKKNLQLLKKKFEVTSEQLASETKINLHTLKGYEFNSVMPDIFTLKKIADFFSVSIDFLLLGYETPYIKFFGLTKLIGLTNELESTWRNHIENSVTQFLTNKNTNPSITDDTNKYILSDNIHLNLKAIRNKNNFTQKKFIQSIGLSSSATISQYEKNSTPSYDILKIISNNFSVSIHYIISGEPLYFSANDTDLVKNILLLDNIDSIDNTILIYKLTKQILKNNNILL